MSHTATDQLLLAIEQKDKAAIRAMLRAPDAAVRYCLVPSQEHIKAHQNAEGIGGFFSLFNERQSADYMLNGATAHMYKDGLRDLIELFEHDADFLPLLRPILDRADILTDILPQLSIAVLSERYQRTVPHYTELQNRIISIFQNPDAHYQHTVWDIVTHIHPTTGERLQHNTLNNTLVWSRYDAFEQILTSLPQAQRLDAVLAAGVVNLANKADTVLPILFAHLDDGQLQELFVNPTLNGLTQSLPFFLRFSPDSTHIPDEKALLSVSNYLLQPDATETVNRLATLNFKSGTALKGILAICVIDGSLLTLERWMRAGGYEYAMAHPEEFQTTEEVWNNVKVSLFKKPSLLKYHLQNTDGSFPKPIPPLEDKTEYLAMLHVVGMAQALTSNHTCFNSLEPYFRNLIANTPGSWSEIAQSIASFTPDDAFEVRRHVHATVLKRLTFKENKAVIAEKQTQDALHYIYDNRPMQDLLAMGHAWRQNPDEPRSMVSPERQAGLDNLLRVRMQSNGTHHISLN